jgi:hypothetical protein
MSSNLPSGLAIDDIMIFVGMDADNEHFDLAMPTGWTAIYSNNSQSNLGGTIAWKRYDGTETDWQFDTPSNAGSLVCGVIHAFSGAIKVGDPTATRGATPSVSQRTTHSASYDPLVDTDTTKLKVHFIIVEDNVAVTDVSDAFVTVHDNQTTIQGSDGRLILGSSTVLQNTSTDGMKFTSGSEYSYNGTFDLTPETNRPTIVPNTADAHDFGADDTPTLEFTGSDANDDDLEYQVQIFSALDATTDSYPISNRNGNAVMGTTTAGFSQSFTGDGNPLSIATFNLWKAGSPTGIARAKLYAHSGTFGTSSVPTGNPLAVSETVDISTLTASWQLVDFTFLNSYALENGTKYCITVESADPFGTDNLLVAHDTSSPTHSGNGAWFSITTQLWTALSSTDYIFYVKTHTTELDKLSETPELEFLNTVSGGDTHPFNSGEKISYTVQTEPLLDSYPSSNQDNETSFINAYTAHSQSFKSSSQQPQDLTKTTFQLRKTGSPTGNATAQLFAHSGTFGTDSAPTGSALATSDNFDVSTLTTSFALIDFIFSTPYTVQPNTNYCIVLEHIANDGTNYMLQARDTSSPTHQGNANYYNGTWIEQSAQDLIFYNYYASEALAEGTYYWRARAQDPLGTVQWSDWTTIRSFDIGASSTYTLTANKGSLSLSGKAVTPLWKQLLDSAKRSLALAGKVALLTLGSSILSSQGSLALSGKNVDFARNYTLNSEKGSLSVGGKDTTLTHTKVYDLLSNKGSLNLSGKNATLTKAKQILSQKGSLSLSGKNADFVIGKNINAQKGSLLLSGKNAGLVKGYNSISSKGSLSINGKDVTFAYTKAYELLSNKGSLSLSGKNIDFNRGYQTPLSKGSLTLTGKEALLTKTKVILSAKGSLVLSGKVAALTNNKVITSQKGSLNLSGKNADLIYVTDKVLQSAKGSLVLNGKVTALSSGKVVALSKGSLALAGKNANFILGKTAQLSKGSLVLSGKDTVLSKVYNLASSKGSLVLSGKNIDLLKISSLDINKGSLALTGKDVTINLGISLLASKGSLILNVQTPTLVRPTSDITALGADGTGTYLDIDEISFSDSDYISSNDQINATYETLLSSVIDPVSSSGHIVRWRQAQADGNVAPSSGGTASTYSAYLYQGLTLIATLVTTETSNEGAFLAKSYTLTSIEADSITNYADLRIRFDFIGSGGSPANRRGVAVSWAEMETPASVIDNVDFLLGEIAQLSKGSLTLSGKNIDFLYGSSKTLLSNKGSLALSGKNINFVYGANKTLISAKGTLSINGKTSDI